MFTRSFLLTAFIAAAFLTSHARAVLVAGTTGNTAPPADDPGWANVGSCNSASAIYLGNQWVLTAFHVNASGAFPVVFGATAYSVLGSVIQLTNNGDPGMTTHADLVMFQINGDPGLPSLTVSATAPLIGHDLVMIGNGRNREAARTFWQVTQTAGDNNDVWTETTGPHNVEGFKAAPGSAQRWGTNDVESVNLNLNDGFGDTRSFISNFDDDLPGRPDEAQAMVGDSGGAVFHRNVTQWELSGVMYTVGTPGNPSHFDNPPADTAVFGQHFTAMADLSFYRSQMLAIMVPEPSAALFLTIGFAFTRGRRRRGSVR
jgi:hypothetical protein